MKSVIIYSGKGGVGKTTTTANIARVLAESGKKVLIIDADINTPSMSTEFDGEHPQENIWIHSTGNMFTQFIYLENAMVRKYLNDGLRMMRKVNPDYILVDTPPSVTNVHLELIKKLKVSHIVFVTQPTALSKEDVIRTASFFIQKCGGIDVSMVENMVYDEEPGEYGIDVVAQISYQDRHNTKDLHLKEKAEYESIIARINRSVDVVQSDSFLNTGIREDFDIIDIFNNHRGKSNTYEVSVRIDGENKLKTIIIEDLKFLSCRTWDKMVQHFSEMDVFRTKHEHDRFLDECSTERIQRLLDAFKEDESAYFMVVKSPGISNIKLITGEIGLASLDITSKSYFGVPRIKYQTSRGSVTLFPYEVKPVDMQEINLCIQDGYSILTDGRYFPPKEIVQDLYRAYGTNVGFTEKWEEHYNSWLL